MYVLLPPSTFFIQVVGAVTKATVGFAVGRAAATVSEEQGLPPPTRPEVVFTKRKAVVGLLSNFVAFLRSDGPMEQPSVGARQVRDGVCGSDAAGPWHSVGQRDPLVRRGRRCERLRLKVATD